MRAKLLTAVAASALIALGATSTAGASVTLGQLAPASPTPATCNGGPFDTVQPTVSSGNSYVVPSTGGVTSWTVTSWSHNASADTGQSLTMKFWRPLGGTTYLAVGHDGPRSPTPSMVNTFSGLSIPVKAGDLLGISPTPIGPTGANNACGFSILGDQWLYRLGNLTDGQSDEFPNTRPSNRLNVTAVIDPTNTFALGGITRNKKKGTATITATVPNPGELTASGKGVKAAGAAVISKAVPAPGTATLLIKAKGKKKRKLNDTGKVKLNAAITFTPTGGNPSTQSSKVKLKKNL
jgi:hypothetical protein